MNREIIKATIIYAIAFSFVIWFTKYQVVTVPYEPLYDLGVDFNLSHLFEPMLVFLGLRYSASIVDETIGGKAREPFTRILRVLSTTLFITLLALSPITPWYFSEFGIILLLAATVGVLHSEGSKLLKEYNKPFINIVITTVVIIGMGFLLNHLGNTILAVKQGLGIVNYFPEDVEGGVLTNSLINGFLTALPNLLFFSAIGTSILCLIGLARLSGNLYISFFGRTLSESLKGKYVDVFIVLTYVLIVRGILIQIGGINPQYIVVAEWGFICILAYAVYGRTKGYVRDTLTYPELSGPISRHVQEIEKITDKKFEVLSEYIEIFLHKGEKEQLIVYLVELLRDYRINQNEVGLLISKLVRFKDREPGFVTPTWRKRLVEEHNMDRRKEVVMDLLYRLQERFIGLNYPIKSALPSTQILSKTVEGVNVDED